MRGIRNPEHEGNHHGGLNPRSCQYTIRQISPKIFAAAVTAMVGSHNTTVPRTTHFSSKERLCAVACEEQSLSWCVESRVKVSVLWFCGTRRLIIMSL